MTRQTSTTRGSWNAPKLQRLHIQSAEGKGKTTTDGGGRSGS